MRLHRALFPLLVATFVASACGDDDDTAGGTGGSGGYGGRPENTGAACEVAADCYPDLVDGGALQGGEALCMDRVRDGYCTHLCGSDGDCCAVEGECDADSHQVCAPFESTGQMMCFLSCEESDWQAQADAGVDSDQEYCQRLAGRDFICRSSGGGSNNRKICVPGTCGVGAACAVDGDCATGLACVTTLRGGYCTDPDACTATADCPQGSLCVREGARNYCYRTCAADSDCSFCRGDTLAGACSDAATFAEDGTTGTVCVPPR